FAEVPSNTLTVVRVPPGVATGPVVKTMEQRYGVKIAGGQERLKGKIFRLGHIGYYDEGDVLRLVGAFEAWLIEHGASVEAGAGAGAPGAERAGSERGGGRGARVRSPARPVSPDARRRCLLETRRVGEGPLPRT